MKAGALVRWLKNGDGDGVSFGDTEGSIYRVPDLGMGDHSNVVVV